MARLLMLKFEPSSPSRPAPAPTERIGGEMERAQPARKAEKRTARALEQHAPH